MQDDTLGISECGYKTKKMNQFLITRTKLMNLQFGVEKCEKMHIGKRINKDICCSLSVEAWGDKIVENENGEKELKDIFIGNLPMKNVDKKTYLGDIISSDGSNKLNIVDRTNKATGTVNKIMTTLQTRPYGKHTYKAAKLMREAMLLGGMLNNAESWININQKDIKALEKPDIMLQRKLLSESGNPSICFMNLELGILPVRFVLMKKRLTFLHYILNESMESMISKVFSALKEDSRRGDFVYLTNQDRKELHITLSNEETRSSESDGRSDVTDRLRLPW